MRCYNGSGRKEAEVRHRPQRRNLKGDHLWNGCGSEAGKDEREPSARPSRRIGKESMRNQAGENEEDEGSESGGRALRKQL